MWPLAGVRMIYVSYEEEQKHETGENVVIRAIG